MPKAHEPSRWEVVSEKKIADCKVFNIHEERCRHPIDGREGEFYSIASPDWVNTIAITPSGKIILVRQYRFAIRELSWEIPGGIIDPGETPLEAGLRELQEDTVYVGENGRVLAHCSPNPAILRNRCHFAYVENARLTSKLHLDANEEIEVCAVPVNEAIEWAYDLKICHTLTINALFHLQNTKGN